MRRRGPDSPRCSPPITTTSDSAGPTFTGATRAGCIRGRTTTRAGSRALLELAKSLAAGERPGRTLVFVAFTGEESGLQGSRYYAAHPAFPLDKMLGVINLDTVGRLDGKKLSVIAAGTASEWQHIFRGAGFVTGVEPRLIPEALESSDQQSFIERGVPAVQVFTDAHEDYHGPGDTADKVDGPGLVRVATFVREAIQYLGDRAEPLTNTIESARPGPPANGAPAADATASGAQGRRVTIGTMPDFAFAGPGVKVAAVTQGSPAEKAGLKEGDILVRLDGREISDLRGYSAMLKALAPGQAVRLVIRRDGAEREGLAHGRRALTNRPQRERPAPHSGAGRRRSSDSGLSA